MKIANAKTFGNNPYATTSDVASAIESHLTNVGHMPSGGTAGNYLRKTEDGTEWADVEIPNLSATIGEEWGYTKITSENVSAIATDVMETSVAGFDTVTIKQSSDDAGLSYTANAGNRTFTFVAGDNVTFTNGDNQVTINAVGGTPGGATIASVSSIASSIASSMMDTRLTSVYTYKGSVENYSSLPVSGQKVGDTYNVRNADDEHGIKAGDNVAWNGTGWDDLSGQIDLTSYALKGDAATDHNHDNQYLKLSGGTVTGTVYATVMSAVDSMSEGGVKLSDKYAAKSHAHEMVDVNGLQNALDSKSDEGHTHVVPDVTGLQNALDAKAAASHSHAVSDVTGLQNALDGKAALSHTHGMSDVTGLQSALNGKAASSHTHGMSDVTGLQDSLDAKAALSHSHAMSDVTGLQDALDAKADADAVPSSCVTYAETLPTASDGAPGCVIVTGETSGTQTRGHVYSLLRHEQSITRDLNVSFSSSVFTSGVFRVYGSGRTNDNGGNPCEYDLAWISSKAASGTNVGEVILFKRKGSDTRWYLSGYTDSYLWSCMDDRCLDISDPLELSGMTFSNPESGTVTLTITDAGTGSPTIDFTCRGETTNLYRINDYNSKPQWRGKVTEGGMAVVHLRWNTENWRLGYEGDVTHKAVYIASTADSPFEENGKEWTVYDESHGVIGTFPVTITEKKLPSETSYSYDDITVAELDAIPSSCVTYADTLPEASETSPQCVIVTGATSGTQTRGHVYSLIRSEKAIAIDLSVSFSTIVFTSCVFRFYGSGSEHNSNGTLYEFDLAWISSTPYSGVNVGEVILFKRKGSDTRWYLINPTSGSLWRCADDRCLDMADPLGLSGMTFAHPEGATTTLTIFDTGFSGSVIDFTYGDTVVPMYQVADYNDKPKWLGKATEGGMATKSLYYDNSSQRPGWVYKDTSEQTPADMIWDGNVDNPIGVSGVTWWDRIELQNIYDVTITERPLPPEVSWSYDDITAQDAEGNQSAYQTIAVKSDALATAVDVVANSTAATITFVGGDNIRLVGDDTNKTVTFSAANTTYDVATTTSDGLMGSAMVTKLDGIASGAEVNQFAFKTVKVVSGNGASTNVVADAKEDVLTLVAGSGVTLTANETGDSITIGGTATGGTTITAAGSDVTSIVASHGASISNTGGKLVIDVPVDGAVTENSTNPVTGSGVFSHVSSEMTKVNSSISSSISSVKTLIEAKASVDDLSQVAFTGNYNDLLNKPSTLTSTPPSQMIDFTSNSTSSVAWNDRKTEATFTHTLNCIPNIAVYDSNWELTNVTIQLGSTPNNSTFRMVLDTPVVSSNAWHCIMTYGHHLGTEVVGPEPEPEPTGKYAVYGLKRDVATLLVDNLSESDLSAYVYNTDGMGIVVLPEGYSAISGNLSGKQFAIKNDGKLYVRTTGSNDNSWSQLRWIPEDTTMLAGHAFVGSAWITPIEVAMVHQDGAGDYFAPFVNFTDHALNGAVPKIKCLTGGGITPLAGEHSDAHFPLCIVEHDTGNRRLVVLTYNGSSAANNYSYCDLVTMASNSMYSFYPFEPTKTDYVACTGPGGHYSDDESNNSYDSYDSANDSSGWKRSLGAAISASGGVNVLGLMPDNKILFYSLDSDVVFKYVSGNYVASNGLNGVVTGSIYVATDTEVKYIKLPDGYIHENFGEPASPSTDMYTVSVTGLPANYTVVKLVGGTGTTDPSVPEGDTDNIVIVKKN